MTPSQSTIEKGDGFRDAVAAILRTKYPDTRTEVRLGSKKVDIVFTRQEFGSVVTFGVECKDYGRPLTKELIKTEIFSDYHPLVEGRLLDRVIIVASKDISADARAYVDGVRWLSHQTLRQLEEDLLGLREYIESLLKLFENESRLSSYYVEARLVGEGSATSYIDNWLAKDASAPLAIMGGYGKGKTSFALRVISEQAKRYLADPTARMPVLIRLGQVVHETQLEGLFGKEFTSRQPANDFKFQTLEYLVGGQKRAVLSRHGTTWQRYRRPLRTLAVPVRRWTQFFITPTCAAIFEGIWNVRKPYAEIATLAVALLAALNTRSSK